MPYIKKEDRTRLDEILDELAEEVQMFEEDSGILNYTITQLLLKSQGNWRYFKINKVVGVLECVKLEFYRRLASMYEQHAVLKNADIEGYREWTKPDGTMWDDLK